MGSAELRRKPVRAYGVQPAGGSATATEPCGISAGHSIVCGVPAEAVSVAAAQSATTKRK